MALTPEDVVNKRFQPTKFREGYDQDEVDDFLDEIVVELRRLNEENDGLRKQVAELEAQLDGKEVPAPAPVAAVAEEPEPKVEEKPEEKVEAEEAPAEEPVVETPVAAAAPAAPAPSTDAQSAAGMLAMAQQLHDQYVADGKAEGERIVAEAKEEADATIRDAQEQSRRTLNELAEKKAELEDRVEWLRGFEGDYLSRMKSYIQGQLRDLDAHTSLADKQ